MLADLVRAGFAAYVGDPAAADFDPRIRRAGPRQQGADYQADGLIGEARRRGLDPAEAAEAVAAWLCERDEVSWAGPSGNGFVNIAVSDRHIAECLMALRGPSGGGVGQAAEPRRVVVDYSSPNIAKEMHAGHLRSTIIGDALVRMLEFDGADVILQNHIGDWGTPFGMLIEHLVDRGVTAEAAAELGAAEMGAEYRAARSRFDSDSGFADRARRRVVELQAGDAGTTQMWEGLRDASTAHFAQIYRDLGVLLDDEHIRGESAYQPQLGEVVDELDDKGLLVDDGGALCAFPDGFKTRDGRALPLIIRKADGGYGYAATDLAAIRYRTQTLGADYLVYVVGSPQTSHLEMVFAVARDAGWLDGVEISHAAFGSVLGADGKMMKSRDGETVPLTGLFDAAVAQVAAAAEDRGEAADDDIAEVARAALKYADLSHDRVHDYTFDPERMAQWDGDTGPYLLYAHTRAVSVFRRAERDIGAAFKGELAVGGLAERQLGLTILEFDQSMDAAVDQLAPQVLCSYAYSLARSFTRFYEECPILDETAGGGEDRLELCQLAASRLRLVLSLLGIDTVDSM